MDKNKKDRKKDHPHPAPHEAHAADEHPAPADVELEPSAAAEPAATDPHDQECATLKDQLLRLRADFDNYRKRVARDAREQEQRAAERIVNDLLPVLDHFELGLAAARDRRVDGTVIAGLELVLGQLQALLNRAGVTVVDTQGKDFDPQHHECVAHMPSAEHPENRIVTETRRGYRMGERLLRAPQVVVSSGPAPQSADAHPPAAAPGPAPADKHIKVQA